MAKKQDDFTPAKENVMGTMPVGRLLIAVSLPMIISMLVSSLYNLVDSIFVAKLSEDALAAVSLAYPVQTLMTAIGAGLGVGVNATLSGSLGEKNREKANLTAGNGVFLCLMCAGIFCLFGLVGTTAYFSAQTASDAVVHYGNQYLSICCIGSIGLFGEFAFNKLLQATGRTKYMLAEQAIEVTIKLILDPLLIFGLGIVPAMGIAGAALSTVVGQLVGTAVSIFFNLRKNPDIQLAPRYLRPRKAMIAEICAIGIPSSMMLAVSSVMSYGMNRILVSFTTTATAVFGIYFKIQSFVMMPVQGINNAMVPIVAYNAGAAKTDRMKAVIHDSLLFALGVTLLGTVLVWAFTENLLSLFSASGTMLEIGIPALRIISLSFVFAGFSSIVSSICQALKQSVTSLVISLIRQVVFLLPTAWVLATCCGLNAVWWAFPFADAAAALACVFILKKKKNHLCKRSVQA